MGVSDRCPIMKTVYSKNTIDIPKECEVSIKARTVQVKGPRGTLTKSFKHVSIDLYKVGDDKIRVEKWFGNSKELAIIKTVSSHITNMFIGVTKGFKYRMKLVYAHFPTNVQRQWGCHGYRQLHWPEGEVPHRCFGGCQD